MAVIEVTIANRTTRHLTASLAAGLRNLVGLGHRDLPSTIVPERDGGAFRLRFGRAGQSAGEIDAGSMTIGVVDPGGWQASWMAHPRHDRDVWDPLRATGQLDSVDWGNEVGRAGNAGAEVSSGGRTHDPLGVLALKGRLKPRGRHTLTLLLTWHFPNFRECDYGPRQIAGRVIGHAYATRFADASDVARAAAEALPRLRAGTDAFSVADKPGCPAQTTCFNRSNSSTAPSPRDAFNSLVIACRPRWSCAGGPNRRGEADSNSIPSMYP
jgi:hypothetical protein